MELYNSFRSTLVSARDESDRRGKLNKFRDKTLRGLEEEMTAAAAAISESEEAAREEERRQQQLDLERRILDLQASQPVDDL